MYLKLDPEYGNECYGILILSNNNRYFIGKMSDNQFSLFGVANYDTAEVTALIQEHFGAVERGGDPNHDCTGRPFRRNAIIKSFDNDDGSCDIEFYQSDWQYDI